MVDSPLGSGAYEGGGAPGVAAGIIEILCSSRPFPPITKHLPMLLRILKDFVQILSY